MSRAISVRGVEKQANHGSHRFTFTPFGFDLNGFLVYGVDSESSRKPLLDG
jgi:hypothetical protein